MKFLIHQIACRDDSDASIFRFCQRYQPLIIIINGFLGIILLEIAQTDFRDKATASFAIFDKVNISSLMPFDHKRFLLRWARRGSINQFLTNGIEGNWDNECRDKERQRAKT